MGVIDRRLGESPIRWTVLWVMTWAIMVSLTPVDSSFDVLHYQILNGWSAWEGRLETDLAPAGLHSYFNPLYNMFTSAMIQALPGVIVSFILGVTQAFALVILYCLCSRILRSVGYENRLGALLTALSGFFSYSMLFMTSSIRNDHVLAMCFLLGLLCLIPKTGEGVGWRRAGLAALVTGLAIGLKLTAIVYAPGLAAAILVAVPGTRERILAVGAAAIAGLAGIFTTGGWWFFKLWTLFGNPVFPLMNGVFKAPLGPTENFRDERFLPETFWDALFYPVLGAWRENEYVGSFLQDFQLGLVYIGLLLTGFILVRNWHRGALANAMPRPVLLLAATCLAILIPWLVMFGLSRYIMAVYMLGPLLFVSSVLVIFKAQVSPSRMIIALSVLLVACMVSGRSLDMRRSVISEPFGAYVTVEQPASVDFSNATVIFTGHYPSAFLAPYIEGAERFTFAVMAPWSERAGANLEKVVQDLLRQTDTPVVAVICNRHERPDTPDTEQLLKILEEKFHLSGAKEECAPFRTSFDSSNLGWIACPLTRID